MTITHKNEFDIHGSGDKFFLYILLYYSVDDLNASYYLNKVKMQD